jgi:hypothetical protein
MAARARVTEAWFQSEKRINGMPFLLILHAFMCATVIESADEACQL